VSRSWTTISCRAFALCAVLLGSFAAPSAAADKPPPPKLPLTSFWSVELGAAAAAPPVSDGDRVFIALKSAQLSARSATDGHELWKIAKDVSVPMAADDGLVFVSAGEAVEAVRGLDGGSAWIVPRLKTVAPLVSGSGWVIAVTDTEVVAIRAKDGEVAWRHAAGGVRLAPDIDGDRVYLGADDGRVLALTLASGEQAWESYLPGGVTAIAARGGRVYAGAGDKQFYCLDGRSGKKQWPRSIGSNPAGRIAVDDERVYFTALNNVVYALDRANGNQRWTRSLHRRPIAGVIAAGHVIFVPTVAPHLEMLYDRDGRPSGALALPGDIPRDGERALTPDIRETPAGVHVFAVTGGLSNQWQLTFIGPVDEASIVPLSELEVLPGVPFLTDPVLEPIGRVLGALIFGDPPLRPVSAMDFPFILRDPPLEPLKTLPGLQLRPLSPVLPIRGGG
jgi:outer membrane protein assembly factor BamB